MTERRYPRSLIEPLLVRTAFPESYRIMPRRHVGSPLGTTPADSRFATRTGSYAVMYAAPDFTTAFKLLPRAHRLAATLDRPIHLWQPGSGEFAIPPPSRWARMGG